MKNKNLLASYYSGLSGLQLDIPKNLYPHPYENATRLTYYSSLFNSIEFNSSFYKIPQAITVSKWASSVNENFKFTFKFWKQVTHVKGLNFEESDVELFMNTVHHAGAKKGCLLLQFPPGLGNENSDQLTMLLGCIRKADSEYLWNIAVEFRNKSWYSEDTYGLLESYRTSIVIHDFPSAATPVINSNGEIVYIRFHGPTGNYRDSYSENFLSEYAGYIQKWLTDDKTVYVYFNNTMGGAFNNLKTLNNIMLKLS